jgi:RNA polymerase I-specific transcription initiation factor RRN3
MIQERILDLIISKCLEIDVEIVIEDSGEVKIDDEDHGDVNDVIFSGDDDGDNNNGNHLSQRVYTEGSQFIPTEVAEMADKLDIVLCQLIEFIQKEIDVNDANNQSKPNLKQNERIEKLSNQLMRIFEEKILLTHRSKFVQFVLFYFAAKIESFGQKFGGRLVKLFLDETAGHVKRQSAILYLASYSVRANFLSVTMIK